MTTGDERGAAVMTAEEPEPPSFSDAIRFVYDRRVRLAARFVLFLALGAIGFAVWFWRSPRVVEGRVALLFSGMEKGTYPSGKAFSIESFRSADILRLAVADAGLPANTDLSRLSASIILVPVIPAEVQSRWKKQDRDGQKREDFTPSQYDLQVRLGRDQADKAIRLFDAIVKRYRDQVRFEQKAAAKFANDLSASSYEKLAEKYDFWEIPHILEQDVELVEKFLTGLIKESKDYKDSRTQYTFRGIANDLYIWKIIRLEALKAATYKGRLVRDKDLALLTAQYRIEDLDIFVRQAAQETAEAMRLLEVAQKPPTLAASQGSGRDAIPIVDSAVIERLMKSDYMTPLVERISELQTRSKQFEATKWRLEKDVAYLQQAKNVSAQELPATYRALIDTLSSELREILKRYNALLDDYLTDSVTSLVVVSGGPRLTRSTSPTLVALGIVAFSGLLALFAVMAEQLVSKILSRP